MSALLEFKVKALAERVEKLENAAIGKLAEDVDPIPALIRRIEALEKKRGPGRPRKHG